MIANPKKGAILGIMLLVALYFWVPLVASWVGKKETGVPAPAAGPTTAGVAAATSSPSPGTQTPEASWHQLAEWMDCDPLKQPTRPRANRRDPFQNRVEVARQKAAAQAQATKKPAVTAETLALSLTGTMVGGGRRIAVLNGKSFRQNDEIQVTCEGQTLVVRLTEVRADRVVVEYEGQPIEIKLRSRLATSHIELMGKNE
jgi:hypothetical protein